MPVDLAVLKGTIRFYGPFCGGGLEAGAGEAGAKEHESSKGKC